MENIRKFYKYKGSRVTCDGKEYFVLAIARNRNNYAVFKYKTIYGYLKNRRGCGDYAEIICKKICDYLDFPCCDVNLATLKSHPFECNKDPYTLNPLLLSVRRGVFSKNFHLYDPHDSNNEIQLAELCSVYKKLTNEEIYHNVDFYLKIINLITTKDELGARLRNFFSIKPLACIDKNLYEDLMEMFIMGFVCCQRSYSAKNIFLAYLNIPGKHIIKLAPLINNSGAFGLLDFDNEIDQQNEVIDRKIQSAFYCFNDLHLNNDDYYNIEHTAKLLSETILNNPALLEFYYKIKLLDIGKICDECDIGEKNFAKIKYMVCSLFNKRLELLNKFIESKNKF